MTTATTSSKVYENVSLDNEMGYLLLEDERMNFYAGNYNNNENANNKNRVAIMEICFGSITKSRMSKFHSESKHLKIYLLDNAGKDSCEAATEEETVISFEMASKEDLQQIHKQVKKRRKRSSIVVADDINPEEQVEADEILTHQESSHQPPKTQKAKRQSLLLEPSLESPLYDLIVMESTRILTNETPSQHQQVVVNYNETGKLKEPLQIIMDSNTPPKMMDHDDAADRIFNKAPSAPLEKPPRNGGLGFRGLHQNRNKQNGNEVTSQDLAMKEEKYLLTPQKQQGKRTSWLDPSGSLFDIASGRGITPMTCLGTDNMAKAQDPAMNIDNPQQQKKSSGVSGNPTIATAARLAVAADDTEKQEESFYRAEPPSLLASVSSPHSLQLQTTPVTKGPTSASSRDEQDRMAKQRARAPMTTTMTNHSSGDALLPDNMNMMHVSWPNNRSSTTNSTLTQYMEDRDNRIKRRARSKINPVATTIPGASFVRDSPPPLEDATTSSELPSATTTRQPPQAVRNSSSRTTQQEHKDLLSKRRARSRVNSSATMASPGASFVRDAPTATEARESHPSSRDAMDRQIKQRARSGMTTTMRPGSSSFVSNSRGAMASSATSATGSATSSPSLGSHFSAQHNKDGSDEGSGSGQSDPNPTHHATTQSTAARSLTSQRDEEDRIIKQRVLASRTSGGALTRNGFVEDDLFKNEDECDDNLMDDLQRQAMQRRQMEEARRDQQKRSEAQQVLLRKRIQEIVRDNNLTPRQKQVKMQQLMASGMPQITPPQSHHLGSNRNLMDHKSQSQARLLTPPNKATTYRSPPEENNHLVEQSANAVPQPIPGKTRAQQELLMGGTLIDNSDNSNKSRINEYSSCASSNEHRNDQGREFVIDIDGETNDDMSSVGQEDPGGRVWDYGDEEDGFQDEPALGEESFVEQDGKMLLSDYLQRRKVQCFIMAFILVVVIIIVVATKAGGNDGNASINESSMPAATIAPTVPASTNAPPLNATSSMTTVSPSAVVLTTDLGSLFSNQTRSENVTTGGPTSMPSLAATITLAPTTTVQPTFSLSTVAPTTSAIPTAAPIFTPTPPGALVATMESLPEFTLEALTDPMSPQSLAYDWVSTHPDLNAMTEQRKLQLFAVATFYYSFQGDTWPEDKRKDYLSFEVSECDWGYLADTSNCIDSDITRWGLYPTDERMPLQGKMPNEMAFLSNLEVLEISFTDHGGEVADMIPSAAIGHLVNLRELILSGNQLQGSSPSAEQLLATVDPLQAEQSTSVGGLVNTLQVLDVGYNLLTGNIPDLSSFGALAFLDLQNNLFTGNLPTELGKLEGLRHLSVSNTFLTGTLPSELGQLTQLTFLDISATLMRGTIPGRICALRNLEELRIDCADVDCDLACALCTCA